MSDIGPVQSQLRDWTQRVGPSSRAGKCLQWLETLSQCCWVQTRKTLLMWHPRKVVNTALGTAITVLAIASPALALKGYTTVSTWLALASGTVTVVLGAYVFCVAPPPSPAAAPAM